MFIYRGDDSGTHTKEQNLWTLTELALETKNVKISKKGKIKKVTYNAPKQSDKKWYISIGQGMGKTITYSEEKQAYTLTDRGTYLKFKNGRKQGLDLEIMCESDPFLNNPYGVIPISPVMHPHVKFKIADKFAKWLVSKKGQNLINNYKLLGEQLFYPDAL